MKIRFNTGCVFNGDRKAGEILEVSESEKGLSVVLGAKLAEIVDDSSEEDPEDIPESFPPLDALEATDGDSAAFEPEDEPEPVPEEKPVKTAKKRKKK